MAIKNIFEGVINGTRYYARVFVVNPKNRVNNRADLPYAMAIPSAFPLKPESIDDYTLYRKYTGTQTFTAPEDGWYKIRVFGASGMGSEGDTGEYTNEDGDTVYTAVGGRGGQGGGYACSIVKFNKGDTIVITCGEGGVKPLYGYAREGTTTTVIIKSSFGEYSRTINITSGANGDKNWRDYGIASGGNIENIKGNPGYNGEEWETEDETSVYASGGDGGLPPVWTSGVGYEGCRGGKGGDVTDGTPDRYPGDGENAYVQIYRGNTNIVA